jgi:hypothetical protein
MIDHPRYLFSINTGRSGSDYLTSLFEHAEGCRSFHEPRPICNGTEMRSYLQGKTRPMEILSRKKIEAIISIKDQCSVYFESNHCFIKGFGWFVPIHIPQELIGVIILKRDPSKISESTLRIGCSPLTPYGRRWIIAPDKKMPLIKPPTTWLHYQLACVIKFIYQIFRFLGRLLVARQVRFPLWLREYELKCIRWYVEETYAMAESFKNMYPNITYYEVDIQDLNSLDAVHEMFAFFGCTAKKSLQNVVGKPANLKIGWYG